MNDRVLNCIELKIMSSNTCVLLYVQSLKTGDKSLNIFLARIILSENWKRQSFILKNNFFLTICNNVINKRHSCINMQTIMRET